MHRMLIVIMSVCLFKGVCYNFALASEVTPVELLEKAKEAMEYVMDRGESCFNEFNDPNSKWIWRGSYVFILNCEDNTVATHPLKPKLIGRNLSGLKDKFGNYFFSQMCDSGKRPGGGWTEYYWPKPGGRELRRKITYVSNIPGTRYQVAAGTYNDKISLKDLEVLLSNK